jgi:hypothetical protein
MAGRLAQSRKRRLPGGLSSQKIRKISISEITLSAWIFETVLPFTPPSVTGGPNALKSRFSIPPNH